MSAHSVFVLSKDGTPLTPTKPAKAKKLLKAGVAKPVWNKFGEFGIQMLVETRKETPKTALGIDNGTKFEGYSVVCGQENSTNTMWKLPDKKKIMKKIMERKIMRKARRWRNCRRRKCRIKNRKRDFITPSQLVIVNSRLKAIRELFKTYPINIVGFEDVRFKQHKKGNNYATVEMGKAMLYDFIQNHAIMQKFEGWQTQKLRKLYGYHKVRSKSKEDFRSHCSDSLAMATALTTNQHIHRGKFMVVDDSYRPVRRKLHYTQPAKGGIRKKYSSGNFRGVRKGTMSSHGLIGGGNERDNGFFIYNWKSKIIFKAISKINWLSKRFFIKQEGWKVMPFGNL
jgi:hypothetical protein